MPPNPHKLKSGIDIVHALHALLKRGDHGDFVEPQLEQCLEAMADIGCSSLEDALAISTLCQTLYCRAAGLAAAGNMDAVAVIGEADRHMASLLGFLEIHSGKTMVSPDDYRASLN